LPEEAAQRRVALALLLARLNRDRERGRAFELPAHDGVCDVGRAPVREEQIDAAQAREVVAPRLPALVEVGLAAVLEVADVLERDAVADDAGARGARGGRRPRAGGAGGGREPPTR